MLDDLIRWVHLLAAAVWVGGMITVAALVPVLRRAGTPREAIRAVARRFGVVAWVAIATSVITGIIQLVRLDVVTRGNTALMVKLLLVGVGVMLAYGHQITARSLSPAARGIIQGLLLLDGLAILAAAVAL